jgi:hypothetical protein
MSDNVTALPHASHASIEEVMNLLNFHQSAINAAVQFILSYKGNMGDAFFEMAEAWGYFSQFEVEIVNMIVVAALKDRIAQAEMA